MSARTLEDQIGGLRGSIRRVREKHGSVHVLAAPDNPLVLAGITGVDGASFHVEQDVVLVDRDDRDADIRVEGALVLVTTQCGYADAEGRCSEDPKWTGGDWTCD